MRIRLLALLFAALPAHITLADLSLATDGKTDFVITLPDNPTPVEQSAAHELQTSLHDVTGATFNIQSARDTPAAAPAIEITSTPGPIDSTLIRTSPHHLLLSGAGPRGVLYAVDSFLENTVGIRWWTSTESTIPHQPTLIIPDLNQTYTPPFLYRECFNADVLGGNSLFVTRLKLNGHHQRIPENLGGHYTLLGWCHTSFSLLSPSKYFPAHPDWYSQINGHRTPDGGQLCWSNPEMLHQLAQNVLKRIATNPSAGIISVSQEDNQHPCQCDRCRAIAREEGSPAGPLLRGVNAVAAEVAKKYPGFLVETLAYQWSRKPPQITHPANNVLIRLCSIEADFAHPLATQDFGRDLQGWSRIADHLFIWNYVTDFSNYLIPDPNLTSIGPDLALFSKNHVVGVFEQGDAYNYPIGDFLPLRVWLQAHLLWNPSLNQQSLINEFLQGYYGPAAEPLGQYLNLINAAGAKTSWGCYHREPIFLSASDITQADKLFAQAESAVADNPTLARRVHTQRLILDHVKLMRYDFKGALKTQSQEAVTQDFNTQAQQFIHDASHTGARNFSEGQSFSAYASSVLAAPLRAIPPKLPKPGDPLPPNSYDIQQDQFYLFKPGIDAQLKPDPKASDGQAATMPGNQTNWAVQFHVPKDAPYAGKGPWRCFVMVRVEAKHPAGPAFTLGIHDPQTGPVAAAHPVSLKTAGDGQYHLYPFVVNQLNPNQYFWIAPPGNTNVTAVYVDRIFIQKSNSDPKSRQNE